MLLLFREHSKYESGMDSPGPAAYTPRTPGQASADGSAPTVMQNGDGGSSRGGGSPLRGSGWGSVLGDGRTVKFGTAERMEALKKSTAPGPGAYNSMLVRQGGKTGNTSCFSSWQCLCLGKPC